MLTFAEGRVVRPCLFCQTLPRLLALKKVAADGIEVLAMRERILSGGIPVVRFPGGRKMCIDLRDIDRFIERNEMTYT